MSKRFLSWMLVMIMLLSVAGMAEATAQDNSLRLFDEPVTITIAGANESAYPVVWNDVKMMDKIEEVFGIRFVGESYGAWKTQLTMMLTTNTLPDVLLNAGMAAEADVYGADGYFLNFMDYIEYMPNLQAQMDADPNLGPAMKTLDGAIYSLGNYNSDPYTAPNNSFMFIDLDMLENLGMDMPTNADELLAVLRACKAEDANGNGDPNDEIPLGAKNNWAYAYTKRAMLDMFGLHVNGMTAGGTGDMNFFVDENGMVQLAETTENYKAYLKYMNTLYSEGLIEPEIFTIDDNQFTEKLNQKGTYLIGCWNTWWQNNTDFNKGVMLGLTSEWNPEPETSVRRSYNKGKIAVNANIEYPVEICKFLDYFLNQENNSSFFEGLMYKYVNLTLPGYEHLQRRDGLALAVENGIDPAKANEWIVTENVIQNTFYFMEVYNTNPLSSLSYEELLKLNEEYLSKPEYMINMSLEAALKNPEIKHVFTYPKMGYSVEDSSRRYELLTPLSSYLESKTAEFILGNEDIDAGFDAFVADIYAMGLEEILEIEQRTYDALH